jgi:hypothetical protein
MLTGGEDPLYIARRLIVVASEDVGMSTPHGLPLVSYGHWLCGFPVFAAECIVPYARRWPRIKVRPHWKVASRVFVADRTSCQRYYTACQVIGMPECRINLAVSGHGFIQRAADLQL